MEWKRGKYLGGGSFCDVNLVIPKGDFSLPQLMAVKSAEISKCCLLKKEKDILAHFIDCPEIVHCFGDDYTIENGHRIYNVFLEYAAGGSLWYHLKKSGGALMESDMKRYTRSILKGLCCIHEMGFVHCDIKLQNILVCSDSDGSNDVKIADFGLAKREGEVDLMNFRGTPLYMSPESIAYNVHEASGDVWSLGCVVAEMVMGRPAWKCTAKTDVSALLYRIGFGDELPEIPEEMSEQGKDFLRRCFVREPWNRWTAQMLLNHPFVAAKEDDDDDTVSLPVQAGKPFTSWSPRSAFDFPELRSSTQSSLFNSLSCSSSAPDGKSKFGQSSSSPVDRIREFVTEKVPNWGSSSDSWIIVREGQAKAESSSSPVFS